MACKKRLQCFPLIFFLFPLFLNAQSAWVSGLVSDSATLEPLTGIVITSSLGGGTVTDINGRFRLKCVPGVQTVTYKYAGYNEFSTIVNAQPDSTLILNIKLTASSKQLQLLVVTSGRYEQQIGEVPVSLEVLRPRLIENKNTNNIEDIMEQVPGVTLTDGQANIRGGSGFSYGAGSRVLLVVDEMPMLSGDASDVKWNYLPVENVSQVEVMKGAASAIFGSSALNGVIHFRTAYPTATPKTFITMNSGFYDEPKRPELVWWGKKNPTYSGLNFGHSRQIGNWDLVVGGHLFNDEGYRYLETEQRERLNLNTRYRFKKVNGLTAGVNVNMMRTSGGLFLLWYNDSLAYIPADSTIQLYKNYRYNVDPFVTWHRNAHKIALRTRFFRTDNRNDKKQGSLADFYYGELQYQYRFKNNLVLTAGFVNSSAIVKSDLYQDHTSENRSGYAQFDKKFFDKLFVTIGIRGEYYRVDSASTEYLWIQKNKNDTLKLPFRPVVRLGATYQATASTFIRASYGQGYRFPSIAEKFIRTDAAGLQIYPNPVLQPEYGQSAEAGIKQGIVLGKWKGYADLAVFWMEYEDMMEFAFGQWGNPGGPNPDPFFGLGFKSLNAGMTRITGVDFSIMGQGKTGKLELYLLAGYTYMSPVSLVFDLRKDTIANTSHENILKYRYRHIAKFDGEIVYKKCTFGMSVRYNSFMENIDKIFELATILIEGIKDYREENNTGDVVCDFRFLYHATANARIGIIGNNIFNDEYTSRPADVQPPRNFAVQLQVKF
ncbi:MAG TPA: TonB-dependent receptor [Bacteroidia bacterium]|nr:TonB-dependent receptor [Bacteroidia bacterium]